MAFNRRDLFRGLLKPDVWEKPRNRPALPDGVDILLDQDSCTAWGKGICTHCKDVCEEHAIFFVGMMNPRILTNRCTLCGDCVPVCPTDAIVVRKREETLEEVE